MARRIRWSGRADAPGRARPPPPAARGASEIVEDGVSGRLWPEREGVAAEIAAAIAGLAADRPRLLVMGRAARAAYAARYTLAAMTDALERIYGEAIAAHRAARA